MIPTSRGQLFRRKGDAFGPSYSTPIKRKDKRKTTTIVPSFMGMQQKRRQEILRRLGKLDRQALAKAPSDVKDSDDEHMNGDPSASNAMNLDQPPLSGQEDGMDVTGDSETCSDWTHDTEMAYSTEDPPVRPPRRIVPDGKSMSLYDNWLQLLPTLVDPLLEYMNATIGKFTPAISATGFRNPCLNVEACTIRVAKILCLFQDHYARLEVPFCHCQSLHRVLVLHGLFPSAPTAPRIAFAIHLLDFYCSLFERSCDATNALSTSLISFYADHGYDILNQSGLPTEDPVRRSLQPAIQWYNSLRDQVERNVDQVLIKADCQAAMTFQRTTLEETQVSDAEDAPPPTPQVPITEDPSPQPSSSFTPQGSPLQPSSPASVTPQECARVLQQRCPACFGGNYFGRSFKEGGDIHVAVDGNFNHRHLRAAGECPQFYNPQYLLPKAVVDAVGIRIDEARKYPPKKKKKQHVPDSAIDECEDSHTSGSGSNQKTNMERYDDGGLMALVCRHDIPLFVANIDTPGERQKYAVSLTEHLFSLLPTTATVAILYDVGCVLDRSLNLYDILTEDVCSRIVLATSAMHAYAHQWACQLVYNPRLREGLGLTDGEGVERLWSRMRKLISITRTCSRSRRIFIIDRQLIFIGNDLRRDLGKWNLRKRKAVAKRRTEAGKKLREVQIPIPTLREQWASQRKAQLSLRAHAPARLKRELDAVLNLQDEFDKVGKSLRNAEEMLGRFKGSKRLLKKLRKRSDRIIAKSEQLLSSLNVQESFPELNGIDIEFVRLLVLARDLKINIRKRAVGSFFEWDRLDQAVGGRDQTIGTRLHQSTRGAISKRSPALKNAIKTFNNYCAKMADLYQPEWNVPLPEPLPLKLGELRNCPHLWEDVWIHQGTAIPLGGLMIKMCAEEEQRLQWEAMNLCRWFGKELVTLEFAIADPCNELYRTLLSRRRLQTQWLAASLSNTDSPHATFQAHVAAAADLRKRLAPGTNGTVPPSTLSTPTLPLPLPLPPLIAQSSEPDDKWDNICELETEDLGENNDNLDDAHADEESVLLGDILTETVFAEEDNVEVAPPTVEIIWESPEVQMYLDPADTLRKIVDSLQSKTQPVTLTKRITFDSNDLDIMGDSTACLNDTCLNGALELLVDIILSATNPADRPALLSTHTLPLIQFLQPDDTLWRRTRHTKFWEKKSWILPIHRRRPGHWVLCYISLDTRELHLFDSYAGQRAWRHEVGEIATLIGRLMTVARNNGVEVPATVTANLTANWVARPLTTDAVQLNGHDCGLWVIAAVIALLHSSMAPALTEEHMPRFRKLLLTIIHLFPSTVI